MSCTCGYVAALPADRRVCDACNTLVRESISLGCRQCNVDMCVQCAAACIQCTSGHSLHWSTNDEGVCSCCLARCTQSFKCFHCHYALCPDCAAGDALAEVRPLRLSDKHPAASQKLQELALLDAGLFGADGWGTQGVATLLLTGVCRYKVLWIKVLWQRYCG